MATLENFDDQKRISAFAVTPSRSSAVANANNDLSTIGGIDIRLEGTANAGGSKANITHRSQTYVLTCVPTATNNGLDLIPNPKFGDKALVYYVDEANVDIVSGYAEFVYTKASGDSGTAGWYKVTVA